LEAKREEGAEEAKLIVGVSPHIRAPEDVSKIMWTVVGALIPAGLWGWYWFGFTAVRVIAFSVIAAMLTEAICQRFLFRRPVTLYDGSAVVTGLLYAYVLPPNVPWYVAVVGAVFAIGLVKQAFGGLGYNIWNPALAARAFVHVAYADKMNLAAKWPMHDGVTAATPLTSVESAVSNHYSLLDLFLGKIPGCIGEVSALLLILGGIVLIAKGYVKWQLPVAYIVTVFILAFLLPPRAGHLRFTPTYHVLAGGVIIGAFFMATDMVTSPLTVRGMVVFGIGAGLLTMLIRLYGGYPEGVCYSILLMNTATPLIDRLTKPVKYGAKKEK